MAFVEHPVTGVNTATLAQNTAGYNNKIPDNILTPDTVETRIGTLKFFDGSLTRDTVELVYDNLDFMRGVETFLNGMPATSIEGLRRGQAELGATDSNALRHRSRSYAAVKVLVPTFISAGARIFWKLAGNALRAINFHRPVATEMSAA